MVEAHVLVVGGTKGIGRALVERLQVTDATRVSVIGRHPPQEIQPPNVVHYAVDVADRDRLLSCIDQAVARQGKLTSIVFMQRHRGGADDFDGDLTVALSATRAVIDHVVAQHYFQNHAATNSIVLVSSIADTYIAPEQSLGYHVSKAGFSQLARYYALQLGPRGIRVNVVSPCVVAKGEASAFYEKNAWLVDRFKTFVPLGRMGRPEDIVRAILFLASDDASYITGQNLVVDGGLTLRSHESLVRDLTRE